MSVVKKLIFVFTIQFVNSAAAYKLNVTNVKNCPTMDYEPPVEVQNISLYQRDNLVDTVGGYYIIRSNDYANRDVVVKMFKCNGINETCEGNLEKRVYSFTCEHYLNDMGPWTIIADAMTGPKCSHPVGTFKFNHSSLSPDFFEGHVRIDEEFRRYRMFIEFWVRNNLNFDDDKYIWINDYETLVGMRACLEMEFDAIFD